MAEPLAGTCLYFGTFNPIHMGHLMIAQAALRQCGPVLGFNTVTFVPAGNPPHRRQEDDLLDARRRVAMVRLAIADHPGFRVSEVELHQAEQSAQPTYTVDTVRLLLEQGLVKPPIPFIIGADALQGLPTWREPQALAEMLHFVQAPRPQGGPVPRSEIPRSEILSVETEKPLALPGSGSDLAFNTTILEMPMLALSSTWIRQALRESPTHADSLRYFLPEGVRRFIRDNGLYASVL